MLNYLSMILGVLLAATTSFGAYEYVENGNLKQELKTATDNQHTVETSNKLKDDAISVLGSKLAEITGQKQAIDAARQAAVDQLDTKNAALNAAQAETKRLRSEIYARDKASRTWAFSPLPGALSRGLQARWSEARGDDGSGDRSAGSSVRGDSARSTDASGPWSTTDALVLGCGETGCYSGDQVLGAIDAALTWGQACVAKLDAIATLQKAAIPVSK